jgi:hypothetical protein
VASGVLVVVDDNCVIASGDEWFFVDKNVFVCGNEWYFGVFVYGCDWYFDDQK